MPLPQRRLSFESILDQYANAPDEAGEPLPTYESLIHPAFRGQHDYIDEKLLPAPLRVRTSGPGFAPPRTVELPIRLEHEPQALPQISSTLPPTSHPTNDLFLDDHALLPRRTSLNRPPTMIGRDSNESLDSYKIVTETEESDDISDVASSYYANTISASSSRTSFNTDRSHRVAQVSQDFSQIRALHASSKAMSVLGMIPQSPTHSRNSSLLSGYAASIYSTSPKAIASKQQPATSPADKTKSSHRGRTVYVGREKALLVLGITEDDELRPSTSASVRPTVDISTPAPSKPHRFLRKARREPKAARAGF